MLIIAVLVPSSIKKSELGIENQQSSSEDSYLVGTRTDKSQI